MVVLGEDGQGGPFLLSLWAVSRSSFIRDDPVVPLVPNAEFRDQEAVRRSLHLDTPGQEDQPFQWVSEHEGQGRPSVSGQDCISPVEPGFSFNNNDNRGTGGCQLGTCL